MACSRWRIDAEPSGMARRMRPGRSLRTIGVRVGWTVVLRCRRPVFCISRRVDNSPVMRFWKSTNMSRAKVLLQRYRLDGRLPPNVKQLYVGVARARLRHFTQSARAALMPVLKSGQGGEVAVIGSRRITTGGLLNHSTDRTALDTAHLVIDQLAGAGIDTFVVTRTGDRLVIGMTESEPGRALRALTSISGPGWFLQWFKGRRSGIVSLSNAPKRRSAVRARRWVVFQAKRLGSRAVTSEAGLVITFWTPGTSGMLELVGTRGHERFDSRSAPTVERIGARPLTGRTAFPLASSLERFEGPIDVVYTWVDGSDPVWLESFRRTAQAFGRRLDEDALNLARYRTRDELRYSLRSVWMYCGWVRRIFIVTAGQQPSWLRDHPMITIVDHQDILPDDALPTFNSHAIEASLHHISGLAEHFVYFNDDMFVARSLRPEVFFEPNGLARLSQSGARVPGFEDERTIAVDTAAIRGRELLAQRFGRVMETKPHHSPYPLLRSVMMEIQNEFPDVIEATRRSRFRSASDVSTAASFAQHYGFATGRGVFGRISTEYVHVESQRLVWHLDRIRLTGDVDTFCINETGVDSRQRPDREQKIAAFLSDMYPVAAPWESDAAS